MKTAKSINHIEQPCDAIDKEKLKRIQQSLARINELMAELRSQKKVEEN